MSVWGASVGLGIAGGAVLAALLDVGSGWRASYWVTAAAAVVLVAPSVRLLDESSAAVRKRVDVAGLVLLVAAMVLAVCALTQGRSGLDAATVSLGSGRCWRRSWASSRSSAGSRSRCSTRS